MANQLNHVFQRQPNGYYCGPAAVRVALSCQGRLISQDELAVSLGTTVNGTNSSNDVVATLNKYLNSTVYYPTFVGGSDATIAQRDQFRQDVKQSIDAGYAVVANVVGTIRTNDGSNYTYSGGHYVTITGYDDNDNLHVDDIAVREYTTTVARMATWIAGRGYSSSRVSVSQNPSFPSTGTSYLIDLASHQEGIDLVAAKAAGVSVVNIKTSEGASYTWSRAKEYADWAHQLDLGVMSFHWVDSSTDGITQARRAFDLHQYIGASAHQADIEDDSSWQQTADYVNEFQRLLGRKVLLYTGDWWWQPRGWPGATLTPFLMAAPNDGYPGSYPGDTSSMWNAGYGGWDRLSAMQFAVSPIPGFAGNVSRTMIKNDVWNVLSGGEDMTPQEMLAYRITGTRPDGSTWDFSFGDFTVGTNEAAWTTLGELRASVAADKARDEAQLAAIQALANAGGVDATPIIAAVNAVRDEARVEYGKLHVELAAAQAEVVKLRAALAAAAQAEADKLKS